MRRKGEKTKIEATKYMRTYAGKMRSNDDARVLECDNQEHKANDAMTHLENEWDDNRFKKLPANVCRQTILGRARMNNLGVFQPIAPSSSTSTQNENR